MPLTTLNSDLATTQYSVAASTFLASFLPLTPGSLAALQGGAQIIRDGDFTPASPVGHHTIEFPFASEGDAFSIIVRQRFMQLATSFRSQPLGTAAPDRTDLLLLDEENFHDEGGGIITWDRVYATMPRDRDVFEDHAYPFQYMYAEGSSVKLSEQVFEVASRVRHSYFHIKDLGKQKILLALRIVQLTSTQYNKRGVGNLTLTNGLFVSTDGQIVAEDGKFRLWKYPIMEMRTRWIAGPTAEFWGESFPLT